MMNMNIYIRRMKHADLPKVMEVERAVNEFPWTESIFSDCITVGYSCWVLTDNETNNIHGFGLQSISGDEAHILNVTIQTEMQGKKLGLMMMQHLLENARTLKARSVFLEVRVSNQRAIQLYKKLGFTQTGERKDYYPAREGREDAFVLTKKL